MRICLYLLFFLAIVDVEHNLEICHLLTYVSAAGTRGISPTFQLPGEAKQRKRIEKYTKDERRTPAQYQQDSGKEVLGIGSCERARACH